MVNRPKWGNLCASSIGRADIEIKHRTIFSSFNYQCTQQSTRQERGRGAYIKIWTRWKLPSQQIQAYLKENNLESSTLIFNFEGVQFGWKMSSKQPEVTFTNNHKEKTVAK